MPKAPIGFEKRGTKYRTRIVVPKELREIVGKTALVESLKTGDRELALKRHRLKWLEFCNIIDAAHRELNAKSEITSLSEEEIQSILSVWLHDLLRQDEVDAPKLLNSESQDSIELIADAIMGDLEALGHDLRPDLNNPNKNVTSYRRDPKTNAKIEEKRTISEIGTDSLLEKHNIGLDRSSDTYLRVKNLVARGLIRFNQSRLDRLIGTSYEKRKDEYFKSVSPAPDSIIRFEESLPKPRLTVNDLLELYLPSSNGNEGTLNRYRRSAYLFEQVIGSSRPLDSIELSDIVSFRNTLKQLPARILRKHKGISIKKVLSLPESERKPTYSATSVNQIVGDMASIWSYAVANHKLADNPFAALKRDKSNKNTIKRRGFSDAELQTIFSTSIYAAANTQTQIRGANFWIPIIALYSGMRQNEICQLYLSDIKNEAGIHYFDLNTKNCDGGHSNDKRLKNDNAHRRVPIHNELMDIGILSYIKACREAEENRLFPDLPYRNSRYSDKFQKWFARFLKATGVKQGPAECFHSYRHTFKNAIARANVPIVHYSKLGGWEEATGSSKLYGDPTLQDLCIAINKVSYPDLDLSHLKQ